MRYLANLYIVHFTLWQNNKWRKSTDSQKTYEEFPLILGIIDYSENISGWKSRLLLVLPYITLIQPLSIQVVYLYIYIYIISNNHHYK